MNALITTALALLFATGLQAQTVSAESMIEQLKPKLDNAAQGMTGKTRSLGGKRNLTVDAATDTETAAQAAKPSLSLLIQFDFNSARVKPESVDALSNLATALQSKDLSSAKFAIEGHTDAKGKADYNLRLSQHRADAVREFLISKGVEGARLAADGKGAAELVNKDDPFAAENRRVKIVNLQ
jgi:outer membrane protein OmpA-like peptidoglycan-associated protein